MRGSQNIPMHGGSGEEIYNAIYSDPVGGGLIDVNYGSSIVMTISYEGGKPKAQGFLTYSQSTDPASPYFADQTRRFSSLDWISFPFRPDEIAADPARQTIRLRQ